MASVEELLIKLTADNKDLKAKMADSQKSVSGFGTSLKSIGVMAGIGYAAAGAAVLAFGKKAYQSYELQAQANRRLLAALKGNTTAFAELEAQASRLQQNFGVDDAAVMQIQMLGAATGKSTKAVKDLTEAAVYLSKATGQDLQSAYMMINATFNGTAGRLTRLDSEFGTLTKFQLENGGAVDLIKRKYEELAKASTTSTDKLKQNWEETIELFGKKISPALNWFFESLNTNLRIAGDNSLTWFQKMQLHFSTRNIYAERDALDSATESMQNYIGTILQLKTFGKSLTTLNEPVMLGGPTITTKPKGGGGVKAKDDPFANMETYGETAMQAYTGFLQGMIDERKAVNEKEKMYMDEIAAYEQSNLEKTSGFKLKMTALDLIRAEQAAEQEKQIRREVAMYNLQSMGMIASQAQSLFAEQTVAYKALAIAQIGISTAVAAIAALSPPPIGAGPLLGPILAGVTIAAGVAAAAKVAGIQFAEGGIVPGSNYSGDQIHAQVNSGEMILNRSQQGRLFDMISGGGGGGRLQVEVIGQISGDTIRLVNKRSEYLNQRRG